MKNDNVIQFAPLWISYEDIFLLISLTGLVIFASMVLFCGIFLTKKDEIQYSNVAEIESFTGFTR